MCKRCAIHFSVKVVSRRSRCATKTFTGSLFLLFANAPGFHPALDRPSAIIRKPCFSALCCRSGPECSSLSFPSMRSRKPTRKVPLPRHPPRRIFLHLVIFENGFPPISPVHDMINFPRILNSQFSCHVRTFYSNRFLSQAEIE